MEVAIKTCKLSNENDDKGKTEKFLEEACKYFILFCLIQKRKCIL